MINPLLLLSIFFLNANYSLNKDTIPSMEIEIKTKKEYELKFEKEHFKWEVERFHYEITSDSVNEKRVDIDLKIKNNSAKPIFIWLMSCSWEDNFLVNNNYMYIKGHDCDKNIPKIVEIQPGESKFYNTTLIKSIKFDYPCKYCVYGKQVETTKLGLIVINDIFKREFIDYLLFMEDQSKWTIIWSNPLYLLGKQPEPKTIEIWKN